MPNDAIRPAGDSGNLAGPALGSDVATATLASTYRVYHGQYDPRWMIAGTGQQPRGGSTRDLMDSKGASKLAFELNEWWRLRGYPEVKHEVKPLGVIAGKTWFGVSSNLHNGLPPSLVR